MADVSTFPDAFARVVRVASLAEQNAVLAAYPPASGGWTVTSRVRLTFGPRVEEHLTLRSEAGEMEHPASSSTGRRAADRQRRVATRMSARGARRTFLA